MSQVKLTADSGGGTVAIKAPASTTGNAALDLTVPGTASATLDTLKRAGNILQVVSAQKTDTWSSSADDQFITVSGLTINITPSSSSNKVFICFNMNIGHSATGTGLGGKIYRSSDSQNVLRAPSDGSRTRSYLAQFTCHSNTNNTTRFVSPCYLDSPSSTSQVSYTFQVYNSGGTVYVNRSGEDLDSANTARGVSFAYAMEVAA